MRWWNVRYRLHKLSHPRRVDRGERFCGGCGAPIDPTLTLTEMQQAFNRALAQVLEFSSR